MIFNELHFLKHFTDITHHCNIYILRSRAIFLSGILWIPTIQVYPTVEFYLSTVNDMWTKKSSVYLISPAIKGIMDPYMLVKLSKWTLFFIVFFFVLNIMFPQFWMIYVRCTIFILYHTSRKLFSFLKAMYLDKNDHLKVNMDAMKNLPFLLNFWTIRAFYPKLNLKYLQTVRNNDLLMHATF